MGWQIPAIPTTISDTIVPEIILRELMALYKAEYGKSLAGVQDFWENHTLAEGESSIRLYDFQERRLVADPSILGNTTQFPALLIAAGSMTPVTDEFRSQQYADWFQQNVTGVYMLKGLNQEELSLLVLRHMQATMDLFERFPSANLSGKNFKIAGTPNFQPSANALPSGGNAMVKGLLINIGVKFIKGTI